MKEKKNIKCICFGLSEGCGKITVEKTIKREILYTFYFSFF